jgi:hypothetical protein
VSAWIGVDLDGTLAMYNGWVDETHIGEPVPAMALRVRAWLAKGHTVKIFTARQIAVNGRLAITHLDLFRRLMV